MIFQLTEKLICKNFFFLIGFMIDLLIYLLNINRVRHRYFIKNKIKKCLQQIKQETKQPINTKANKSMDFTIFKIKFSIK